MNVQARDDSTLLHLAAEKCDTDDVASRLRLGADRTHRNAQGRQPADWAPHLRSDRQALLAG